MQNETNVETKLTGRRLCGSSLLWGRDKHADKIDEHKDRIAVALGALDAPTGLKMAEHIFVANIFVANRGDYYDIADGLPQKETC